MQDLGHWLLDEKLTQLGELPFGFVYIITNNISNRKYIGKKQCIHSPNFDMQGDNQQGGC